MISLLAAFGGYAFVVSTNDDKSGTIAERPYAIIHNKHFFENEPKIRLEIADSAEKQFLGLSNREALDNDSGMLFIFQTKRERAFVMRNMRIPLDIIWIVDDRIIGCSENLRPEGAEYKEQYPSPSPINYVLEVNAGFCRENDVEGGDIVEFFL